MRARTEPVGPPSTVTHSSSTSGFAIAPGLDVVHRLAAVVDGNLVEERRLSRRRGKPCRLHLQNRPIPALLVGHHALPFLAEARYNGMAST